MQGGVSKNLWIFCFSFSSSICSFSYFQNVHFVFSLYFSYFFLCHFKLFFLLSDLRWYLHLHSPDEAVALFLFNSSTENFNLKNLAQISKLGSLFPLQLDLTCLLVNFSPLGVHGLLQQFCFNCVLNAYLHFLSRWFGLDAQLLFPWWLICAQVWLLKYF